MRPLVRSLLVLALVAMGLALGPTPVSAAPTPQTTCGAGAAPESGIQGRIARTDYQDGRAAKGYRCNTQQVGHSGSSGGFRVYRYVDAAGHECAYYDTTLLVGVSVVLGPDAGVAVLDMSDPAHPVRTATLVTPAMLSPHESLNVNQARGLLAAVLGSPATAPGIVDVYDLTADCRHPVLRSSTPLGGFGHEATFSPDGRTFWVAATSLPWVTALDLTNPSLPVPVWTSTDHVFHGMNVSDDGNRLYAANLSGPGSPGLAILDVRQVQARVPNPSVPTVSTLSWSNVSIPQTAIPVTIGGKPFLVEIDEYSRSLSTAASDPVGGGRIIDIGDERHPRVVSQLRLAVNEPGARTADQAADPGASTPAQGYGGHYCSVPQRKDPGIVACSFIVSGLRVFDIHDPTAPKEIAYFNPPTRQVLGLPAAALAAASAASPLYICQLAGGRALRAAAATPPAPGVADIIQYLPTEGTTLSHWAMSAPTFVPERNEVWYSDGMYGFYAVRLTNGVWSPARASARSSGTTTTSAAPTPAAPPTTVAPRHGTGQHLPATGGQIPLVWVAVALAGALATRRLAGGSR